MDDLDTLRQNVEDLVCDPLEPGTLSYAQEQLISALEFELKALKKIPCWRTDDGYRFYWVDGQWVDSTDPECVDMDGGFDSRCPRDYQWNPLSGGLEEEGATNE